MLALSNEPSGAGVLEPLQAFMTNPAGAAMVNAIGPIRQVVHAEDAPGVSRDRARHRGRTRRRGSGPTRRARKGPATMLLLRGDSAKLREVM